MTKYNIYIHFFLSFRREIESKLEEIKKENE